MKASEAFKALNINSSLLECCDFGTFYGFVFSENDEQLGTGYICVNKETGDVFPFNPFDDFDIFEKGIQIPIAEVLNVRKQSEVGV